MQQSHEHPYLQHNQTASTARDMFRVPENFDRMQEALVEESQEVVQTPEIEQAFAINQEVLETVKTVEQVGYHLDRLRESASV